MDFYRLDTSMFLLNLVVTVRTQKTVTDVICCWQYVDELRASSAMWDHYEVVNKSHVDISNVGEYFMTAIETLLISQRRMHIKVSECWCLLSNSTLSIIFALVSHICTPSVMTVTCFWAHYNHCVCRSSKGEFTFKPFSAKLSVMCLPLTMKILFKAIG